MASFHMTTSFKTMLTTFYHTKHDCKEHSETSIMADKLSIGSGMSRITKGQSIVNRIFHSEPYDPKPKLG